MSKFNSILCIRLASSERREFKNKGYYGVKIPNKSSIMYNHKTNLKFDDLASLSQLVYVNEELKYDQDLYNFIKDYPTGQKFYVFENNSVYATGEFINDSYVKNNELRRKATFPLFKACLFPKNMKKVEEFSFYINDHFRQEFLDSRLQTKKDEPVIEIKESVEKVSKKKKRESSTVVTIIRKDSIEEIGKYNPTTHERKEIEQEIRKYGDVVTPLYQSEVYQSCVNATKQRLANLRSYNDTNHMVSSNIKFSKTDVINSIYTKNKHIPKIIKTAYNDYKSLINVDVIGKIELIEDVRSYNKHSFHDFDLNGIVKDFAYEDINGKINIVKLAVFYCKTCDVYFDYVESYKSQLQKAGIPLVKVFTKHVNQNGTLFEFDGFSKWKEESTLKHFGYAVGYNGLSQVKRQQILKFVIQNHFMTINEVKKLLNQFISYNGRKSGNEKAKRDWELDLLYVNDLLIGKNK